MMRTLAFINLKGGTGKTVSAANTAHILATVHKKRVLLVDADKQGNASRYFGLYGQQKGTAALMMDTGKTLELERYIYATEYKGLNLITSNMDLYNADREMYADEERDRSVALRYELNRLRNDYDFCVIDNGPAADMVTLNVLMAADDVLIPIRPDEFSFSGLLDLIDQVESVRADNPGLTLRGAFFTHWQNRELFAEARRSLEESRICPLFKTAISFNPRISESTLEEKPLCAFAGRSWAAIQYKKLVQEFLDLTDSDKGKEK